MNGLLEEPKNYYEYVFNNSIKSDFEIVLKDKVLRVHKEILAQQNPVFLDKYISQPEVNKIEILDFDSNAVELFINYLYTGRLLDSDVSEELFRVAHKYLDLILKGACREKFLKTLNFENSAKRLLFFLDQGESKLIKETSKFIARNFNEVKLRPDFNLVLEKKEALDAVLNGFDECRIIVLSENKNPNQTTILDSARESDLTIKVQNHSFLGHKEILATRNSVFKNVIAALPNSGLSSSVNIPDFSLKTFKIFLEYIYTQNVDEKDITTELLDVAHKYVNSKLQKICEEKLISTVCEENAVELLILSANTGSGKLKVATSKCIADKYLDIKERDDFRLVKQNPEAVQAIFDQFSSKISQLDDSFNTQKATHAYVDTFKLKVPLTVGCVFSKEFYMRNIAWDIFAELKEPNLTHLGLFLRCKDDNDSLNHKIEFSLVLISSVNNKSDVLRNGTFVYSTKALPSWGWPTFVSLVDLNDKKKGLILNGSVVVRLDARFVT